MRTLVRLERRVAEFGLWGSPLYARLRQEGGPRVLLNSVPKAGTNLGVRVLYLMSPLHRKLMRTMQNSDGAALQGKLDKIGRNQFAVAHLYYSDSLDAWVRQRQIRHVLFVRDPRDIAVSSFRYVTYQDSRHRLHHYFRSILKNDDQRLMAVIAGIDGSLLGDGIASRSIAEHVDSFMGWMQSPDCHMVRFEEVVGPGGGGRRDAQEMAIAKIAEFLGMTLSPERVANIAEKAFDIHSRTFSIGAIGGWRSHFKEPHVQRFNEIMGDRLDRLGYGV